MHTDSKKILFELTRHIIMFVDPPPFTRFKQLWGISKMGVGEVGVTISL